MAPGRRSTWTSIDGRARAARHVGGARLGDARRTRRLVTAAEHIRRHPRGGLPQQVGGGWAETVGLYRLLAAPAVTRAAVLAPHRAAVPGRLRGHDGVVPLVHDATGLNFSHVAALRDQPSGTVGSGRGAARGPVAHRTPAVTPGGAVLGLVHQVLHRRAAVDPRETEAQKRRR